jgi:hypothetical protein
MAEMDRELRATVDQLIASLDRAGRNAVLYLASPAGQRMRRRVAAGMLVGAPLLLRLPAVKRHPVVKLLDLLGGTAAVLELARLIREWEPESASTVEVGGGYQQASAGPNGQRTARAT